MRMYFIEKISDININMRYHKGNAKERLASQSMKINKLPNNFTDESIKKMIIKVQELCYIDENGYHTREFYRMRLMKAVEIIKILDDLQEKVEHLDKV